MPLTYNQTDSLEQWSNKWLLSFHLDKCHVLTLGEFHNIMHTVNDRLSAAALIKVFRFLGAALILKIVKNTLRLFSITRAK